ncbi:MAG: hypothetical protein HKM02_02150, partial [Pseudomonadales bacterium]|nr:hypothetical protein [Pseudomonadales bacterium]
MIARKILIISLFALIGSPWARAGSTTNITENFTGTSTSSANTWESINACLTAGSSSQQNSPILNSGSVPGCATKDPFGVTQVGGYTGSLPDPTGKGALRLTNDANDAFGAIFSTTPFDSSNGVNITFITETYEGDSGGAARDGADGIGFYLLDGTKFDVKTANTSNSGLPLLTYNPSATNIKLVNNKEVVAHVGAFGGSLGYSCANGKSDSDGLVGGYLGLGMDEYGNYLNGATVDANGNITVNDNTASGTGLNHTTPMEIGLRGNGNVSWEWINANYSSYETATVVNSDQNYIVQLTCRTGYLWQDVNDDNGNYQTTQPATDGDGNLIYISDFAMLPNGFVTLSSNIANESATTRQKAYPIFYKLQITSQGFLTLAYAYNGGAFSTIINNRDITKNNGTLPKSLYFGFGASTGGSRNIHEITCFKAVPTDTASSSATANTQQTGAVQTSTQVYLAYYHPSNWWGSLQAYYLTTSSTGGITTVALNTAPNWDATCDLTGTGLLPSGVCPAGSPSTGQPWSNRVMMTWQPVLSNNIWTGKGVAFRWSSADLTTTMQNTLNAGNPTSYKAYWRLQYLRGNRSEEQSNGGVFRDRTSVLGDIQDSSPQWVGAPNSPYTTTWQDLLNPANTMPENTTTYASYKTLQAQRENIIYAGANDGFLHGFRSGYYSASGQYQSATNDGQEVMAYMPQAVFNDIHTISNTALDYSNQAYAHQWYVDSTPGVGDLYYQGAWHTWLVGGIGAGGADIYALDVTNPTLYNEANAGVLVKGDWIPASLICAGNPSCGQNLGGVYGDPQIRRLHDGNWGAIFGNGLGSANGTAGLFIMEIDSSSGAITFRYLDTGVAVGSKDGIAYAAAADLDGDHVVDYVYAGDLLGNVWRFDLTSSSPSNWKASSFKGGASPSPLFTT